MAYDTKTLREAGKVALAAEGMPVELDTSGHGANQLYRVRADAARNASKLVRLRTNNRWAILDYATGPEANAPIEQLKGVDYVCGVCVNPQDEIEVYFIPADRVDAHYKAEHDAFMKRTKGLGDSNVRILKFRNASSSYAEFKLGRTPAPAASSPRLSMLCGDVIERAKRMVADEFGVPVSAVRISVDFITPHGRDPVASDMAVAAAEYDRIQRARDVYEETVRECEPAELQRKQIEADRLASAKPPGFTSELEEIHAAEDFIEQIEQTRRAKEGE